MNNVNLLTVNLERHIQVTHQTKDKGGGSQYRCTEANCDKEFQYHYALVRHLKTHAGKKHWQCHK